mgnify:CR=1 FL=1
MAGEGQPGYCKLCAWEHSPELDKGIRAGWNAAQAGEWAKKYAFSFNRQSFYKHKVHALTPEQRVVQIAETKKKALDIKRGSNTNFLEAIRDIGYSKAIEDPDQISIDHALKAVALLEGRKDKSSDQLAILISVVTGQQPPTVVIEGEAVEA